MSHLPTQLPRSEAPAALSLHAAPSQEEGSTERRPVFGFILVGGTLVGAQVRDIRLANELVRRGYEVHVWWAFDRQHDQRLDPSIQQHWLFSSARYSSFTGNWFCNDLLGKGFNLLLSDRSRNWIAQHWPNFVGLQMEAIIDIACRGVEKDRGLIRRFASDLSQTGVTHLLPNIEVLALFAAAARPYVSHPVKFLVTFQGYEVYANYARAMGCEHELYQRLAEVVEDSDWPAIAVSEAYAERIVREVRVPRERLCAIPPGIPVHEPMERAKAMNLTLLALGGYRPDLPLIGYVGRRDSEKGIDLLLYAARILAARGVRFQVAICGPTAFGSNYERACAHIAAHLRVPVLSSGFVSTETRTALFRTSRAVVYPSIHEEPFGMVPVEGMAQGTPAVVPNIGGVASVTQVGSHRGGLQFAAWDTRDLADQLQILIENDALHGALSAAAPHVAEHFSVAKLGERVLDHLGLPHWHGAAAPAIEAPSSDPIVTLRRAA